MRAPKFWQTGGGALPFLLWPLSMIWKLGTKARRNYSLISVVPFGFQQHRSTANCLNILDRVRPIEFFQQAIDF